MKHTLKAYSDLYEFFEAKRFEMDCKLADNDTGAKDSKSDYKTIMDLEIDDAIKELEQLRKKRFKNDN